MKTRKILSCLLLISLMINVTACSSKPNTIVIKGVIEEILDSRIIVNHVTGITQENVDKATIAYDNTCEIEGEMARFKTVEITVLASIKTNIYPAEGKAVKIVVK